MPPQKTTKPPRRKRAPAAAAAAAAAKNKTQKKRETTAPEEKRDALVSRRIHVSRLLPQAASDLQLHGARGRLRVAVYAEFFPVAYTGPDGRFAGLDVDLIQGFCASAGLRPHWVRLRNFWGSWGQPGAWERRVDVAIGGIGRDRHRDQQGVEWTVPYFEVQRTVVYRLADPVRRFPDDVTGVVAGTMGSTGMDDALHRLRAKFGDKAWDHLDARWKSPDAKDVRDLLDGKIQGLMRGSFVGKAVVAQHPGKLGMAKPWSQEAGQGAPFSGEVFAFPCRRGSGLAAQLSMHLLRLSQSGELAKLVRKHGMA